MATKKGVEFERETASLAGEHGKRIQKSGAVGTTEGVSKLAGDAQWRFPWASKIIAIECKHGYSRPGQQAKSMTLYREWFEKLTAQSKALDFYPAWAMKLKFTSDKYMVIPFTTMQKLLEDVNNLYLEKVELERNLVEEKQRKRAD